LFPLNRVLTLPGADYAQRYADGQANLEEEILGWSHQLANELAHL